VNNEFPSARLTAMAAGTNLDPKFKRLQIGIENNRFKTEAQSLLIDRRHLANPHADLAGICSGMKAHFGSDRVQHRICDSQFVHIVLADARQLIA
jgi:hypothetical protein